MHSKIAGSIFIPLVFDALKTPDIKLLIHCFPGEPNSFVIFFGISFSSKMSALIASSTSCVK